MNKLHKIKLALAFLGVTATLTGWSAPATTLAALPEGWVQTDPLVKFTKSLLAFIIALVIYGVIQIGLIIFDYWLEKQL
jgi:hypothetical protein